MSTTKFATLWSVLIVIVVQVAIFAQERVVTNTDLVTLRASVTDAQGSPVLGLERNAFVIEDNHVVQKIAAFSDEDEPASIAVVFDVSGSMSEGKLAKAKQALATFIQTSDHRDEFFLVSFDSKAHLLVDKSRDADAILSKLTYVNASGNTALYDALYLALEKLSEGSYPKRAILLITDGEDNNSRYTLNDARRRIQESDVSVFSIGVRAASLRTSATIAAEIDLRALASKSGGAAFFPTNSNEIAEAFDRIAVQLRHQYSISFRPTSFTADGQWHQLKIRVVAPETMPRIFVRSRSGYFARTNFAGMDD